MALPSWRDQTPQNYVGAAKWGTGVNRVHGQHADEGPVGRDLAPGPYGGVSGDMVSFDYGYADDSAWDGGYGVDLTFMQAHPNWGDGDIHGTTGQFPDWGRNGIDYRSLKIGTNVKEQMAQVIPNETVTEGWVNKPKGGTLLDSEVSDPSQYEIMTSWRQRDLTKTNDAAVLRGTDDARSGIATRLVGMKQKIFSEGKRHEDMTPRTQDAHPRPWLYRSTADGVPDGDQWLPVNAMTVTDPLTREVPADVYQGVSEVAPMADQVWTEGW